MARSAPKLSIRRPVRSELMQVLLKRMSLAAGACVAAATAPAEQADNPVTHVVPFAAGGPFGKLVRDLAESLPKPVGGQSMTFETVGGTRGTSGAAAAARAANDGYALLLYRIGTSTAPALYQKMPYETLGDVDDLGLVDEAPTASMRRPTPPASNDAELVQWQSANKGKGNLRNASLGAALHRHGRRNRSSLQIDKKTVPNERTDPAVTDLLGGQSA